MQERKNRSFCDAMYSTTDYTGDDDDDDYTGDDDNDNDRGDDNNDRGDDDDDVRGDDNNDRWRRFRARRLASCCGVKCVYSKYNLS